MLLRRATYRNGQYELVPVALIRKIGLMVYLLYFADGYIDLPKSLGRAFHGASKARIKTKLKRARTGVREDVVSFNLAGPTYEITMFSVSFMSNNVIRVGGRSSTADGWQSKSTTTAFTDTEHFLTIECTLDLSAPDASVSINGTPQIMTSESMSFGNTTFQNSASNYPRTGAIGASGSVLSPKTNLYMGHMEFFEVYLDDVLVAQYNFNEGNGSIAVDSSGNGHDATLVSDVFFIANN